MSLLERTGGFLRRRFLLPEHPLTAIEVRPRSLGLVRLAHDGERPALAAAAALELPEGSLALSLTQPNLADKQDFKRCLEALLDRAGAGDAKAVTLVLPDPVARVALLPAAELRARTRGETEELVRFRLRKALPFDVREARVVHAELPAAAGREPMALVAAVFQPVLEGYEAPLRELGLDPGLVELSGLALLRAAAAEAEAGDGLVVNWDFGYFSLMLDMGGQPALIRTLVGEPADRPEEVAREVANTVLYYTERLGGRGLDRALVRSAHRPPEEALALLREPLGIEPRALDPWQALAPGERPALGPALAGAAACLLARAA